MDLRISNNQPLRAPRLTVAPAAEPGSNMAVDAFERTAEAVVEPVTDLVASADNKRKFNKVASRQTSDVFALRTSAWIPMTAKQVVDAGKAASKAIAVKAPVAPIAPTGWWGRLGTGLGILDIGAGFYQALTGISELRLGKRRDGVVNLTGGITFAGSSALYLAGKTVLGPLAAAASCFIPGANELAYGLQEKNVKKQISGGALIAGGVGFTAMAAISMTGLGAGATVLGLPLMAALGVGTTALLIGRAAFGNWDAIKNLAGRIGDRLGLG